MCWARCALFLKNKQTKHQKPHISGVTGLIRQAEEKSCPLSHCKNGDFSIFPEARFCVREKVRHPSTLAVLFLCWGKIHAVSVSETPLSSSSVPEKPKMPHSRVTKKKNPFQKHKSFPASRLHTLAPHGCSACTSGSALVPSVQ